MYLIHFIGIYIAMYVRLAGSNQLNVGVEISKTYWQSDVAGYCCWGKWFNVGLMDLHSQLYK